MKARSRWSRRRQRRLLADVEHLAEAAAETIEWLHKAGLAQVAQPLEDALVKLAR